MSAHLAISGPVGSIIGWSDGTPRPSERHHRKLSAWRTNNSSGRLIRRQDEHPVEKTVTLPCFTLHEADYGAGGVTTIRVHRTFSSDTSLTYSFVERPVIGSCRVFDRAGDNAEFVHLAANGEDVVGTNWMSTTVTPKRPNLAVGLGIIAHLPE
ncbi:MULTISPECIES: hypothetical protein [Rhizobium/Agrobacterium group]|uniref:hypothetical protein n=1 Tax=Rhizobium/Agrobacterium group TaxID=227290 RepID=UPI001E4D5A45|nr:MULTISPECIES: hypothetical protein [Rhizobium/Agrobacterium group]